MISIRTPRLLLRPPAVSDAGRISLLAGDYDVASMTGTIPHPCSELQAKEWIESALSGDDEVVFAITLPGGLIGCTGYRAFGTDHAELGYWIGKPYWGQGYATEAVLALIAHAFDDGGFDYLTAGHFTDNPASERVLAQGRLRVHARGDPRERCARRYGAELRLPARPRGGVRGAAHRQKIFVMPALVAGIHDFESNRGA